ncbi:uncharacterized protein LOC116343060 [Contarinia nasturtii]|uniref:uncharacterized protein LOC116343060 n=1 Tax=Contarinia nasturtii TaxID=265458 RepID=UPI0012D3C240|nr:uncharacterized protein LOC116343060 [Contarinia nasturtii]
MATWIKPKLPCCEENEKNRKASADGENNAKIHCDYCQCTFSEKNSQNNHSKDEHGCRQCNRMYLTKRNRIRHRELHKQEELNKQTKAAAEKKERENDNRKNKKKTYAFVTDFLIPKKLDEFEPDPECLYDFNFIFRVYRWIVEKDDLVFFIKRMKMHFGDVYELIEADEVIYLLQNGAVSIDDASKWIDRIVTESKPVIEYFLDNGIKIEPRWVARNITDNRLIERIKIKHQFTFNEVYTSNYRSNCKTKKLSDFERDCFYVNVHHHFPNPDFVDPFKNPYEEYTHVTSQHVKDILNNRYWYNQKDDELFILVGEKYGNKRRRHISLGTCKNFMNRDVKTLIDNYNSTIYDYEAAKEKVSKLFAQLETIKCDVERRKSGEYAWISAELFKGALPERNTYAADIAKLYFIISQIEFLTN